MIRLGMCALAVVSALAAAGCGGERTDVSQGIDEFNTQVLAQQNARLDCPDEVDGGDGTEFDCTLASTREGGPTEKVRMRIVTENDQLKVDVADQKAFSDAVAKVARS